MDPGNNVLEENETNNVTRIIINLNLPDDDADGLSDTFEMSIGTDPLNPDSDGDGLSDYDEVAYDGDAGDYDPFPAGLDLDALNPDTDGDGRTDRLEVSLGLDPLDASDGVQARLTSMPFIVILLLLLFFLAIRGLSF